MLNLADVTFPFLVIQFLNGLTFAMFLFLIASGLSLVFGVLQVLNFAHGSLYMLGAYLCFTFASRLPIPGHFWAGILLAPIAVAGVGGLIERTLLRRIYGREESTQLLLTYGLVLIFEDLVKIVWGPGYISISQPTLFSGAVDILGRPFPTYHLLVLVLGPSVALGLGLFLYRTTWGKVIRACVYDREMVSALGYNVARLFSVVFVFGSWLGGFGGALAGPIHTASPGMGMELIIESFIVVVVGGLGSFGGALLGSLLIGELKAFGILLFPEFELAFIYILMGVVLITRPWGLLGRPITAS